MRLRGLQSIFEYIGGIPRRLVFDNATGVGRKVCNAVRTTKLFGAFGAHHGFEFTFCNPAAGNEKGNVESKVGAIRRALFVPLPRVADIDIYNRRLLQRCANPSEKDHCKKGEPESQLFAQDRLALMGLPSARFDVVRYERHRADKYGKITLGGNHRYSSDPTYARRELIVGIKATKILLYDNAGTFINEHERAYGKAPSDSTEPARQLALLCDKPGGWRNSQVRRCLSEDLRSYMDAQDKELLKPLLRFMRDESATTGYGPLIQAFEQVYAATGALDGANIAAGDTVVHYDEPVDLSVYDVVFSAQQEVGA